MNKTQNTHTVTTPGSHYTTIYTVQLELFIVTQQLIIYTILYLKKNSTLETQILYNKIILKLSIHLNTGCDLYYKEPVYNSNVIKQKLLI